MGLYDYVDIVAGDGATIADLRAKLVAAEERERMLRRACLIAQRRFSTQNGHVTAEVWSGNYEAVAALRKALAATEATP